VQHSCRQGLKSLYEQFGRNTENCSRGHQGQQAKPSSQSHRIWHRKEAQTHIYVHLHSQEPMRVCSKTRISFAAATVVLVVLPQQFPCKERNPASSALSLYDSALSRLQSSSVAYQTECRLKHGGTFTVTMDGQPCFILKEFAISLFP
jgi:hypothetical protein